MVPYAYVHRMMGQGHSIPIYNLDMPSNTISHSYAGRSIDGETSLAQFVCLSVSLPLLAPSTHPLQKLLCGGEERRRPNCVFRFTLADVQRPEKKRAGKAEEKRDKDEMECPSFPGLSILFLPQ